METGSLREFVKYGKLFVKPKIVSVDHHEQQLFIIGELEGETQNVLVKVNYDDTQASILYKVCGWINTLRLITNESQNTAI